MEKNTVFVLDTNRKQLAPCCAARARILLRKGKAAVFRRYPFTIILKRAVEETPEPMSVKIDPGSRHTGMAIVAGDRVVWLGQIEHKTSIQEDMLTRKSYRNNRRYRKTRYRKPRFDNRRKPDGWFPPTIESRIQNVVTVVKRLMKLCPIKDIQYELVQFDTQLLQNPDIEGREYQEGPLYNTEMRTFLLATYQGVCQYCGGVSKDPVKEWEHVQPKSRGGSNSVNNATLACHCCNSDKGDHTLSEWKKIILAKPVRTSLDEARLEGIDKVSKHNYAKAMADAAITNAIRWKLKERLEQATHLPVYPNSSRYTKYNRVQQNLPKEHCIDAACVGRELQTLRFKTDLCMVIEAKGRGRHCRTNLDKFGFPRSYLPRRKQFFGFQTGQMVRAVVPEGKKQGTYYGSVACRSSGSFDIKTPQGRIEGINYKYCKILAVNDGYRYSYKKIA